MSKKSMLPELAPPFEGFSDRTFRFLHGLRKNNNKEWFDAHRADYESELRFPSRALVERMAMLFAESGLPLVADPRRSLFRINRDIRFSADKSPYKTHIGIVFPLADVTTDEWSGMYFAFEPEGSKGITSYCGGGIHQPSSAAQKTVRAKIASESDRLKKLLAAPEFVRAFPDGLRGESLKRMPRGYEEDHPAAGLLKMKEWVYSSKLSVDQLTGPELPEILLGFCKAGVPVLEFFGR